MDGLSWWSLGRRDLKVYLSSRSLASAPSLSYLHLFVTPYDRNGNMVSLVCILLFVKVCACQINVRERANPIAATSALYMGNG